MKVLIAPDKFRGSLTAAEAAAAMAAGVARYNPDWTVQLLPVADGGEGTAEVLTAASGGSFIQARASDPLLRYVSCQYGISADGTTAFINLAEASGLQRLEPHEINAFRTSTIGTGQLIVHALTRKCSRIVLGLGGSATIDCGIGIAHALGIIFQDEFNGHLSPIGGNLPKIEFINARNRHAALVKTAFIVLHDVDNPLLGAEGAAMFAAQKGISSEQLPLLETNLNHFANLVEAQYAVVAKTPGMGAAGGAAMACMAFLGAKLARGSDFVLDALKIPEAIATADLVITGEGHLDEQSLQGKAAIAVARQAQHQNKPVLAVCGRISLRPDLQIREGITLSGALMGSEEAGLPVDSAKELALRTEELLRELAPRIE
ncbi:MAG: glycerate kinase [Bacteroidetes bacterium]|nr:glycerate kinase [Bacteroidota bacterium]